MTFIDQINRKCQIRHETTHLRQAVFYVVFISVSYDCQRDLYECA